MSPIYIGLLLLALAMSALFWMKRVRHDPQMMAVFFAAVAGSFIGAKVLYLLIEGRNDWVAPDRWMRIATGKTVVGALLGGFLAVEWVKVAMGVNRVTGDLFASIAPLSLALGRVGCWQSGCCLGRICDPVPWALTDSQGVARWPAVPVELAFNLVAFATFWFMRSRRMLPGQHFHLYIMAYGFFRLVHEPMRATPKWASGMSGYQVAAVALLLVGAFGFWKRAKAVAQDPHA